MFSLTTTPYFTPSISMIYRFLCSHTVLFDPLLFFISFETRFLSLSSPPSHFQHCVIAVLCNFKPSFLTWLIPWMKRRIDEDLTTFNTLHFFLWEPLTLLILICLHIFLHIFKVFCPCISGDIGRTQTAHVSIFQMTVIDMTYFNLTFLLTWINE